MKVFLLKDVENVGIAGQIVAVSDGYAVNLLLPRKLAVEVTAQNEKGFSKRVLVLEHQKERVVTKTSLLAEKIKSLKPTISAKVHDGDKLYGAIRQQDVVDLLKKENVSVSKNQIIFEHRSIETKGVHPVRVKLSNSLQPVFMLKVVAE